MDMHDLVLAALARMTRKKPADIAGHLSLGSLGLSSSFGLSALRSQLEAQTQRHLPAIHLGLKVDELVQLLLSDEGAAPTPAATAPSARPQIPAATRVQAGGLAGGRAGGLARALAGIGLGMDLQDIAAMPEADDFRSHAFYTGHFTSTEIATAALKPHPRVHLCGIFCAKEAAKKSHPRLLALRMLDFNGSHDAAGRPLLQLLRLPAGAGSAADYEFLLSITHTAQYAAATCITHWASERADA
jgi:holo-[acyl-carrier protein] synthase